MGDQREKSRFETREQWLVFVAGSMEAWFTELGYEIPKYRISIGFPSTGKKGKRVAECWDSACSEDGTIEMLIRPDRADPMEVASDLAHEMIHAVVGVSHKHRGPFKKAALAIGFLPPMTTTPIGPRFLAQAQPIIDAAGLLPHAALRWDGLSTGPKPQKNRHVKMVCSEPGCEFHARTSRKLIDQYGPAICPKHHVHMVVEGDSEDSSVVLDEDTSGSDRN